MNHTQIWLAILFTTLTFALVMNPHVALALALFVVGLLFLFSSTEYEKVIEPVDRVELNKVQQDLSEMKGTVSQLSLASGFKSLKKD